MSARESHDDRRFPIWVCPEGCSWFEGNTHDLRPLPHHCSRVCEVVDLVPVEVVPASERDRLAGEVEQLREERQAAVDQAEFTEGENDRLREAISEHQRRITKDYGMRGGPMDQTLWARVPADPAPASDETEARDA